MTGPYRTHNSGDDWVGAIIAKRLQQEGYDGSVPKLGRQNVEWLGIEYAEASDSHDRCVDGGIMSDTSGAIPGTSYLEIVGRAALAGQLSERKIFVTSVGAGPWLGSL